MLPKDSRVDTYWIFLDDVRATPTLPVLPFRVFAGAAHPDGRFARALTGLYTSTESRYLNFYGPPRTISTVSYSDVLGAARANGSPAGARVSDAAFKGKAVFVGYAAATPAGQDRLRDAYRTVCSKANGQDLSGVEIAATAFART